MDLREDAPFLAMRRIWQPVANAVDLPPGKVASYRLLDTELVIARLENGQVLAADVSCPHKGARLSAGMIEGDCLRCAYHGWTFDSAGRCLTIPSVLDPTPEKLKLAHLHAYPTQERYGFVWVKLESAGTDELPSVPEFEDPAWTYVMGPPMRFAAGFRREIENYLDMSHFAFAHKTTLGRAADPKVPDMKITIHADGGFEMNAPFPALASVSGKPGKLQSAHHRRQRGYMPNFTTIRQTFEDKDERVLLHVPSPNTRESCTVFWSLAISPAFDGPASHDQIEFAMKVLDEDRQMCELQIPAEVPLTPGPGGWGVLVTPGDTLANTFQKCFRNWLQRDERLIRGTSPRN